mmetsp:Transcript_2285/g.6941  ORF Transcript_2285/g.6941 Transcript_2285/m.6941 type:complete len:244 (+) Transcript_2285:1866-2597(+)
MPVRRSQWVSRPRRARAAGTCLATRRSLPSRAWTQQCRWKARSMPLRMGPARLRLHSSTSASRRRRRTGMTRATWHGCHPETQRRRWQRCPRPHNPKPAVVVPRVFRQALNGGPRAGTCAPHIRLAWPPTLGWHGPRGGPVGRGLRQGPSSLRSIRPRPPCPLRPHPSLRPWWPTRDRSAPRGPRRDRGMVWGCSTRTAAAASGPARTEARTASTTSTQGLVRLCALASAPETTLRERSTTPS